MCGCAGGIPRSGRVVEEELREVSLELVADPEVHSRGYDPEVRDRAAVIESNERLREAARLVDQGRKSDAIEMPEEAGEGTAGRPGVAGSGLRTEGQPVVPVDDNGDGEPGQGRGRGRPEGDQVPGIPEPEPAVTAPMTLGTSLRWCPRFPSRPFRDDFRAGRASACRREGRRDIMPPMVFSSITFLFFFLPVVLTFHLFPGRRWRNVRPADGQPALLLLGRGGLHPRPAGLHPRQLPAGPAGGACPGGRMATWAVTRGGGLQPRPTGRLQVRRLPAEQP